jgi:hypothetical protein
LPVVPGAEPPYFESPVPLMVVGPPALPLGLPARLMWWWCLLCPCAAANPPVDNTNAIANANLAIFMRLLLWITTKSRHSDLKFLFRHRIRKKAPQNKWNSLFIVPFPNWGRTAIGSIRWANSSDRAAASSLWQWRFRQFPMKNLFYPEQHAAEQREFSGR